MLNEAIHTSKCYKKFLKLGLQCSQGWLGRAGLQEEGEEDIAQQSKDSKLQDKEFCGWRLGDR